MRPSTVTVGSSSAAGAAAGADAPAGRAVTGPGRDVQRAFGFGDTHIRTSAVNTVSPAASCTVTATGSS